MSSTSSAAEPLITHDPRPEHGSDDPSRHSFSSTSSIIPDGSLRESDLQKPSPFVWALTAAAGISGLLFGYDTGVISSTLTFIHADLSNRALSSLDQSLITSITPLGALISSPVTGILSDRYGRKRIILTADTLFIIGAIWQAFTTQVWGMIAGRLVVGLAVGSASLIVPLYISELSPTPFRGRLVTLSILFITLGQVLAYSLGYLFSSHPSLWRLLVGLGALPALLQLTLLYHLPDSPRWLVQNSRMPEARRALDRVYAGGISTDGIVDEVLRGISRTIDEEGNDLSGPREAGESEMSTTWMKRLRQRWKLRILPFRSLFATHAHRRALSIACLLQGFQQLCGFNSLMYFSGILFTRLGFEAPTLVALSVAGTNAAFTIIALLLIDRVGRRRMLLWAVPFMILGLVVSSVAWSYLPPSASSSLEVSEVTMPATPTVVILLSLTLYVATYALSLGTIPWQQSELFPLSVRGAGAGISTAMNWGANTVVGLTFLPLLDGLGGSGAFGLYATICMAGWVAVWAIYPEMGGCGLEDVGKVLQEGWWVGGVRR